MGTTVLLRLDVSVCQGMRSYAKKKKKFNKTQLTCLFVLFCFVQEQAQGDVDKTDLNKTELCDKINCSGLTLASGHNDGLVKRFT